MIYQSDTTIIFSYKLSSSFVSKVFIETGKMLARDQKLVIDASKLSESERAFLVHIDMPLKETVSAELSGFFGKILSADDVDVRLNFISWV